MIVTTSGHSPDAAARTAARLRARRRARGPRAARGQRPDGATTCGCSSATGGRSRRRPLRATSVTFLARRRPGGREHVGHGARRGRRPPARRRARRRALLERAARRRCGWSRCASPAARHAPHPVDASAHRRPRLCSAAARCTLLARFAGLERLWVRARSTSARPVLDYLARARPSDPLPLRAPRLADRGATGPCSRREPGSAEMPSAAGRSPTELVTDLVGRGIGIAPAGPAHRRVVARGRRAPVPRALPGARARPPTVINAAQRRRRAGRSPSAPPSCARWRPSPTTAAWCTPAQGWTDSSSRPTRRVRAVDGLLTGWHEPESTHLLMLEAVAGRAPCSSARTRRRSTPATAGTSSATATSSSATHRARDARRSDGRGRASRRLPDGPAGGALRPASPRRGDRRAGRRAARHDRERRPPAPHRAGRRRAGRGRRAARRPPAERGRPHARVLRHRPRPTPVPEGVRRAHQRAARLRRRQPTATLLDQLFAKRRATSASTTPARRLAAKRTLRAKVAELARILDEDGYLATFEQVERRRVPHRRAQLRHLGGGRSGTARPAPARSSSSAPCCPSADVERVQHMVAGARHCAYEVRAR